MNEEVQPAIRVLLSKLDEQLRQVSATKKGINAIYRAVGEEPMFPDEEPEQINNAASRPDLYYGKALATAAQMYLERRKQACSAEEIHRGLRQGGFDFAGLGWKEKDSLRSLAMSLAKNTKAFHKLPNNTFGLISWYDRDFIRRKDKPETAEQPESAEEGK